MDCCEPQKVPKRRPVTCLYRKQEAITHQQAQLLSPLGQSPIQKPMNTQQQENNLIQKVKKNQGELLEKKDDFTAVEEEQGPLGSFVMKKMQRSSFDPQEMHTIFQGKSQKWTDPDFVYEKLIVAGIPIEWKRPQEFMYEPDLLPEQISPGDVVQGWINNCYFLSAVACLTEKPHRIFDIFSSREYNPKGFYVCKLYFNGVYQEVIVDDLFPVLGGLNGNKPVYAKPAQKRYIWVMVLEKCWAKLLKGYSNTNFGYTSEAFQALTGAPTNFTYVQRFRSLKDMQALSLFQLLKKSDEQQYVTEVSIKNFSNLSMKKRFEQDYGLPTGHAYSLLGVYQTRLRSGEKVKLVQIRNPWGDKQSKLMWGDKDPLWQQVPPAQKQRIMFHYNTNSKDGVFYMNWEDFIDKFDYMLSICEINDNSNYTFSEFTVSAGIVRYLQVQTNGQPQDLAIYFVQDMEQHFREDVQYWDINVVVSKLTFDSLGSRKYEFKGAANYYSQKIDNYFTLPLRKFPRGQYLIRFLATPPTSQETKLKLVAGLYSPAAIGLRQSSISDKQFVQKTFMLRAQKNRDRLQNPGDPASWIVREVLAQTKMGYVMFHFGSESAVKRYRLLLDQRSNKNLHFMFENSGRKDFVVQCERGFEYLVVFGYTPSEWIKTRLAMDPSSDPEYQLPRPRIVVA